MGLEGASAIAFLADMSDLPVYRVVQQRWEHSSWVLLQALPRTDGVWLGKCHLEAPCRVCSAELPRCFREWDVSAASRPLLGKKN